MGNCLAAAWEANVSKRWMPTGHFNFGVRVKLDDQRSIENRTEIRYLLEILPKLTSLLLFQSLQALTIHNFPGDNLNRLPIALNY